MLRAESGADLGPYLPFIFIETRTASSSENAQASFSQTLTVILHCLPILDFSQSLFQMHAKLWLHASLHSTNSVICEFNLRTCDIYRKSLCKTVE